MWSYRVAGRRSIRQQWTEMISDVSWRQESELQSRMFDGRLSMSMSDNVIHWQFHSQWENVSCLSSLARHCRQEVSSSRSLLVYSFIYDAWRKFGRYHSLVVNLKSAFFEPPSKPYYFMLSMLDFTVAQERSLDCTYTHLLRKDHIPNITLYGSLPLISSTLRSRRLQFACKL